MSNPNEDSQETHFSSKFARHTAGQLSRDEERALTEHQVRGRHWTAEGTRRSTRTSGSRGATPVHRVMHDSENESHDSYLSGKSSHEMDGPLGALREGSDSSDLSLPPPPSLVRSHHSEDSNISPSLRSPPRRPPGAGNVYPLPPDMAAIEASVHLEQSGQPGDGHIRGFTSRPHDEASTQTFMAAQPMLQHQAGRAFGSPYSANQQQVSRVIDSPPVTTTGPVNQSQQSEVINPTGAESENRVTRSQFHAPAQDTGNQGHPVPSAVSESVREYQSQPYNSAVSHATTVAENNVPSRRSADRSGGPITVTAGQPTPHNPMHSTENNMAAGMMSQAQPGAHPYFMSGAQTLPPHPYHPTSGHSMFSMAPNHMMYHPHQHPSPWMTNTIQGKQVQQGPHRCHTRIIITHNCQRA